jgi:8-oxo-dGTP pyrophosphatase MutT (NUDIX family)
MSQREKAFGGVVVDAQKQVLLREPTNHFDGYVWTFAKGRPEKGETPEVTALREVLEETGVTASIVAPIPGSFAGGVTENVFFLMAPESARGSFGPRETQAVRWVSFTEAARLISKTTNEKGRARDLAVLKAASDVVEELERKNAATPSGPLSPRSR